MIGIIPQCIVAFDPQLVHDLAHDNTDQWWIKVDEIFENYRCFYSMTGPVERDLSLDQI